MQEYLKIVLNNLKNGLFLTILVAFGGGAQQSADFSLQLSVEPSKAMFPGQQGVMTFTITNGGGDDLAFLFGGAQPSSQHSGQGHTLLVFDSFHFGSCTTGSISIQPPLVVPPLWSFEVRDLATGATEVFKYALLCLKTQQVILQLSVFSLTEADFVQILRLSELIFSLNSHVVYHL